MYPLKTSRKLELYEKRINNIPWTSNIRRVMDPSVNKEPQVSKDRRKIGFLRIIMLIFA